MAGASTVTVRMSFEGNGYATALATDPPIRSSDDAAAATRTLWYVYSPSEPQDLFISVREEEGGGAFAVLDGAGGQPPVELFHGAADESGYVRLQAVPGRRYWIGIGSEASAPVFPSFAITLKRESPA